MNFLGVGPFEILLILVIATIVLGPERMAQAGRALGRLYAQYRLRWQKDVDEMTRELRRELAMLQQEVDEIRSTAETEIRTAQAVLEEAVDEIEHLPGKQDDAAKSGTAAVGVVTAKTEAVPEEKKPFPDEVDAPVEAESSQKDETPIEVEAAVDMEQEESSTVRSPAPADAEPPSEDAQPVSRFEASEPLEAEGEAGDEDSASDVAEQDGMKA
jgi:Sec-independent protein translocase protein TatA